MERVGEHAVVVGASVGGLLAAAALAGRYRRVTVVERDVLPAVGEGRRAVPQGRHVHALLPSGERAMEALLPGIAADLVAAGAVPYEPLTEMRFRPGGHLLARASLGLRCLAASRPLIEGHVRRRVAALDGVTIADRRDVVGLIGDGGRVRGVRVLGREEGSVVTELEADLVIGASGRGGRLGAWLEALGFARPREERVRVDLVYASRELRLPVPSIGGDKVVLLAARPGVPRGVSLFAQEHGRWLLTVSGYGAAHRPPADGGAHLAFAAALAPPDVLAALRAAEPLGDVAVHGFPASVRRRWERMERWPAGLVPIGDAIASFNPIYGQGMSVAALEAVALRDCLAAGPGGLERRYARAAARIVDAAWALATGADLALPHVPGPRPARVRVVNAWMRRLLTVAERDPAVAATFMRVAGLLDPPQRLLAPATVARVAAGTLRGRPRRADAPGPVAAPASATALRREG